MLLNIKVGKCTSCGYNQCPQALAFHHLGNKEFLISNFRKTKQLDLLKIELDKCEILCFNCHNEHHYNPDIDYQSHERKNKAVEYKGGKCTKCGYDKCPAGLTFHHTDPNEKDYAIANNRDSFDEIKIELDKCILLCGNCHNEHHYEENQLEFEKIKKEYELLREINPAGRISTQVITNCETCNKELSRFKSSLVDIKNIYCSRSCKYMAKKLKTKHKIEKLLEANTKEQVCAKMRISMNTLNEKLNIKNESQNQINPA